MSGVLEKFCFVRRFCNYFFVSMFFDVNVTDLKSDPISIRNPMRSYKMRRAQLALMFQYACCCLCWWCGCGVFAVQVDTGVFIEVHGLADVGRALFLFVVGELSLCVACGVPFNVGC